VARNIVSMARSPTTFRLKPDRTSAKDGGPVGEMGSGEGQHRYSQLIRMSPKAYPRRELRGLPVDGRRSLISDLLTGCCPDPPSPRAVNERLLIRGTSLVKGNVLSESARPVDNLAAFPRSGFDQFLDLTFRRSCRRSIGFHRVQAQHRLPVIARKPL